MLVQEGYLGLGPFKLTCDLLVLGLEGGEIGLGGEDLLLEVFVVLGQLFVLGFGLDCTGGRLFQSSLEIGQLPHLFF